MSENLHNIDDLFRQNLEPIQSEPGSRVWEQIEHSLDKDENRRIRGKYMRWKRWAVAATLLLSVSLFALYISNRQSEPVVAGEKNINKENKNQQPIEQKGITANNLAEKKQEDISNSEAVLNAESKKNASKDNTASENTLTVKEDKATIKEGVSTIKDKSALEGIVINKEVQKKPLRQKGPSNAPRKNYIVENRSNSKNGNKASITSNQPTFIISGTEANKEDKNLIVSKEKTNQKFTTSEKNSEESTNTLVASKIKARENFRSGSIITKGNYTAAIMPSMQKMKLPTAAKTTIGFGVTLFYEPQARFTKVEEGMKRHREDDRNEIKDGERMQIGSSYGLLIDHKFRSKWRIQTGIGITEQSSIIEPKPLFARKDDMRGGGGSGSGEIRYKFNCAAGTVFIDPKTGSTLNTGDSVLALSSVNSSKYLQIPLRLSYAFSWGKFSLLPTVGLQSYILKSSTLNTTLVDNTGTKTPTNATIEGLRSMYMTAEIGLGLEFSISKRLSVYVMPRTGFSLSPINKETPVRTYTKDISAVSGLRFQL